jgi:chromate transport protein ChrA
MQVVITVGSLCAGELMCDRLNIAAVVTLMVMFMFSLTSLMLIASSFVTTELMMTMTYSLRLIVLAMVIASSWRESSCW